jgi:hypothetical protein
VNPLTFFWVVEALLADLCVSFLGLIETSSNGDRSSLKETFHPPKMGGCYVLDFQVRIPAIVIAQSGHRDRRFWAG